MTLQSGARTGGSIRAKCPSSLVGAMIEKFFRGSREHLMGAAFEESFQALA